VSKGKHAAKAENRNIVGLQSTIDSLQSQLAGMKGELHSARKEVARLRGLAHAIDNTKDLLVELRALKEELRDAQGKNFVLEDRLRRWAKVITAEQNREFVNVNRDMVADIVELGYWPEELVTNRASKRNTRTAEQTRKISNLQKAAKEAQRG